MVLNLKQHSKRITRQRRHLLFEQLEHRQLMTISPGLSPPPLELTGTPPPEQTETPPPLTGNWTPMVYAGTDLTTSLGNDVMLNGEAIANLAFV